MVDQVMVAMDHYSDIIMGAMALQITSLTIGCSTVYTGADQRKQQSSGSLAFVRGIHRLPQRAGNAEHVSIWWRHHVINIDEESTERIILLLAMYTSCLLIHVEI